MKKHRLSILVAIAIAFVVGFFVGSRVARPSGDPVRQASTVQSLSSSSTATKKPSSSSVTYYILNTSTKKFHKPSCSSVKQMKESNKKTSYKSRDEIIGDGYDPCGRCHP